MVPENILPYKCSHCSAEFKDVQQAKMHFINAHNIEKPLKLNKDITSKNSLERRISSVHEKKQEFKCESCGKGFSKKCNIKPHMESVHEGKKSFKCKVCDKNFSHKHHMIRHIASVHETQKAFECESCDYSCSQMSSLKTHTASVHLTVHDGKKALICLICDYRSSQKGEMKKHILSVHEGYVFGKFCQKIKQEPCSDDNFQSPHEMTNEQIAEMIEVEKMPLKSVVKQEIDEIFSPSQIPATMKKPTE